MRPIPKRFQPARLIAASQPCIVWRDTPNFAAASVTVNPSTCTANTA
jgi:hypothetical protein